ncbi:MAG TPA: methyl-accepting chemotaxis protein [Chloroflexia bacterium]|nr:methyl-accepting chemotaxis protein [Chloroflexia bacterium]
MIDRLLDCAATTTDQVRKGRWLNGLLLGFIVLSLALSAFALGSGQTAFAVPDLLMALLMSGLYWFNRRGHVAIVAPVLVSAITLFVFALALSPGNGLAAALTYPVLLVLVIIAAGVFLTWRVVPVAVVSLSVLTVVYYEYSTVPSLAAYRASDFAGLSVLVTTLPILFLAVGALSWLSNRLIGQTLTDLRHQNAELEAAYMSLAAQSQREHQLGADIGGLATQLSAVSTRQVSGVSAQAQAINAVVSVVAELHEAADQIAGRAQEVREAADSALRSVQRGQELIGLSRDAVQRNRSQVLQVIERMTRVGELTTAITEFVNHISDLSDETHLLALNATIEAAGAGVMGRRFSVVANEVQNLSRRSSAIVEQVRELIEELQEAGQVTLAATHNSIMVADEVEGLADQVREMQEQVVQSVQRTSSLMHMISSATTQQTAATQQMTHTMQEIADVASATRHDTTALERAIREMTNAAGLLESAITRLRPAPRA